MAEVHTNRKIKNLFVVDWKNTQPAEIERLLNNVDLENYNWSFYNCLEKKYIGNGIINRYFSYFIAVIYILRNKKKYDNIIIWQQMIGLILCQLPKFYSKPKIIITTLLYSPDRVKARSFRLFLLEKALKKADALVYYSCGMAQNVINVYPAYAKKIFSTYLPITNKVGNAISGTNLAEISKIKNSVFTGGSSDRDFETLIKAFSGTNIPVTIVCTKNHIFQNPEKVTRNFTIVRSVTEIEYFTLALSSEIVVIPLENEYSSCGQLLFTFCMSNGIPIIATDCYGTRDYITNNDNGFLVPAKDHNAIFNSYMKLLNDIETRNRLVKRSKEISANMTFDNYLKKIYSIIQQIQ